MLKASPVLGSHYSSAMVFLGYTTKASRILKFISIVEIVKYRRKIVKLNMNIPGILRFYQ